MVLLNRTRAVAAATQGRTSRAVPFSLWPETGREVEPARGRVTRMVARPRMANFAPGRAGWRRLLVGRLAGVVRTGLTNRVAGCGLKHRLIRGLFRGRGVAVIFSMMGVALYSAAVRRV